MLVRATRSGAEQGSSRDRRRVIQGKAGAPATAAPATPRGAAAPPPDAGKLVTLPDGTPVTAPSEQAANATRAVCQVRALLTPKGAGIDVPPPGTPVTTGGPITSAAPATSPVSATQATRNGFGERQV